MEDAVGWASSVVLMLTIGSQIYKQYKEGSTRGVSRWLFIGQVVASTGFVVYSVMVNNWVFITTNTLILLSALVGCLITLKSKRQESKADQRQP